MSNLRYFLVQLRSKLWLKPALTGLGAVAWVEIALFTAGYSRLKPPFEIERDILLSLLQILASTMLTVAIFAVSAMVAAFSSVTTTATPRATQVVMEDRSSQNALAAFLSAFIYAIVALVAVSAIPYGAFGRFMLFTGYVLIIGWVLFSFVRWVDQVSKLGRIHDTISRVEAASLEAFKDPMIAGTLGGKAAGEDLIDGERIHGSSIGYVRHIDIADIEEIAAKLETVIRLEVRPGAFVDRCRPIAVVAGSAPLDGKTKEKLIKAFTIGSGRQISSDPRFGLVMLAEIADRALSPGINDPGTAIAVIGSQIRLLTHWVDATRDESKCEYPHVEVAALSPEDLLDDGFTPIARDGAGMIEVGIRLQKALGSLHRLGHPGMSQAVARHSRLALEQAIVKLPTGYHRGLLEESAARAILVAGNRT